MVDQNEYSAVIETLSHDGRGIARIDGKTTFLTGGLPGETVQFHYLSRHRQFDEGRVSAVTQPSSLRETPPCPHFGECGGCDLQHMALSQQLQHKQSAFQDLLLRQAQLAPSEWLPPIMAAPWGYRRKARLGVKYVQKKGRVLVGFRERRGRWITDSRQCNVLIPAIGQRIEAFSTLIERLSIRDQIPQLEIAAGDNTAAVVIRHLSSFNAADLALIEQFAHDYAVRIYLQPKGIDSVHLFYPKNGENLHYCLPRYHLKLEFHPTQFIQINAEINKAMVDCALALLDLRPEDNVLDLFCGIGNFSLAIARSGATVVGVEGDKSAVEQAIHNAALNQLSAEFHCTDLFSLPFSTPWAKKQYDKILLDPPRSGAAAVIEAISQWNPSRIVYVSCDMATMARDAAHLNRQGYRLIKAGVMDMFPHTQHVETIALFVLHE